MKRYDTEFIILPAFHGDCILIKTFDIDNNEFVILVDGGTAQTFKYFLKAEIKSISHINLLIVTHIDSDHVAGLISLFKSSSIDNIEIDEVWINHPELIEVEKGELISTKQGNHLKDLITAKKPEIRFLEVSTLDKSIIKSGIEFIILSPTPKIKMDLYQKWQSNNLSQNRNISISSKQDKYLETLEDLSKIPFSPDKSISDDIFNSSSIAVNLKCRDMSILLLADSRPEVICESLKSNGFSESNPLKVDYVKISHHGSLNNTSQEQLGLISSNNFIISTNGGTSTHKHPSRETIARIIFNSQKTNDCINIYFNYEIESLKQRVGDFIKDDDFKDKNWIAKCKNRF